MIWLYIISFFLLLVCWILFAPVILRADSLNQKYRMLLPGVFSIRVIPSEEKLILIRLWIFFVPIRFDLFHIMNMQSKKKEKKEKKREKIRFSGSARMFRKLPGVVRIRKLEMDLDTDDFMVNAWLVPVFTALNQYRNIRVQVNFEGNLALDLDIRTRIGAILWLLLTNR